MYVLQVGHREIQCDKEFGEWVIKLSRKEPFMKGGEERFRYLMTVELVKSNP
jgi:hypothetical protein